MSTKYYKYALVLIDLLILIVGAVILFSKSSTLAYVWIMVWVGIGLWVLTDDGAYPNA